MSKYVNSNNEVYEGDLDLQVLRHTASHIMAQAIKRLFPQAKLAIGPAIENGFYYDIDVEPKLVEADLEKIEAEMKKIIKENLKIESFKLPRQEALKLMEERNEPYKVELINELPEDEEISFFKQGEFVDLCVGPHLLYTKALKAFKLFFNLKKAEFGLAIPGNSNNYTYVQLEYCHYSSLLGKETEIRRGKVACLVLLVRK